LSPSGLAFQLELGARLCDEHGDERAPLGMILETYCRNSEGKRDCLELLASRGVALPDTAPMAIHRSRLDLLEPLIARDPGLLNATFAHDDIFPRSLGCHEDWTLALGGTPVSGGTLLHLCVDYNEIEIARWLIARGAGVNVKAGFHVEGFGGHTTLFNCVVSQPEEVRTSDTFARLLLDHGADPNVRASIRKRLIGVDDETAHDYHDVTPLSWGERFHDQRFVSRSAMQVIAEHGGRP
jgi:hypothetical protein